MSINIFVILRPVLAKNDGIWWLKEPQGKDSQMMVFRAHTLNVFNFHTFNPQYFSIMSKVVSIDGSSAR